MLTVTGIPLVGSNPHTRSSRSAQSRSVSRSLGTHARARSFGILSRGSWPDPPKTHVQYITFIPSSNTAVPVSNTAVPIEVGSKDSEYRACSLAQHSVTCSQSESRVAASKCIDSRCYHYHHLHRPQSVEGA